MRVRLDLVLQEGDEIGDEGEPRDRIELGEDAGGGSQLVGPGPKGVVLDLELALRHGSSVPEGGHGGIGAGHDVR